MLSFLLVWNPYIALPIAGGVLLVVLVWWIAVKVARHRHDKLLEKQVQEEIHPPVPQELRAEVTVIPTAEEAPTVFMPVPAAVSDVVDFVDEARDGICIRSFVRAEDVNHMMSGEQANALTAVVFRPARAGNNRATVYLDTLSDQFSPYSFVNLAILRKEGIVGEETTHLVIHARGVLRKPLMVEADAFSLEAVKMLSLTGGRAILIRI